MNNTKNKVKLTLEQELQQFIGSTEPHQPHGFFPNISLTVGAYHLAEKSAMRADTTRPVQK